MFTYEDSLRLTTRFGCSSCDLDGVLPAAMAKTLLDAEARLAKCELALLETDRRLTKSEHRMRLTVSVLVLSGDRTKMLVVTRKIGFIDFKTGRPFPLGTVGTPGGHVEVEDFELMQSFTAQTEEMLENAAIRELEEETGLQAGGAEMVFCSVDDDGNYCAMMRAGGFYDTGAILARPDGLPLTAEPGTMAYWINRDEMVAKSAWPKYYQAARDAGAF